MCPLTSSLRCSGCHPALAPRTTAPSPSLQTEGTLHENRRSDRRWRKLPGHRRSDAAEELGRDLAAAGAHREVVGAEPSKAGHWYQPGLGSADPGHRSSPSGRSLPPGPRAPQGFQLTDTRRPCLGHWSTSVKKPEQVPAQFLWRSHGGFSTVMNRLPQESQRPAARSRPPSLSGSTRTHVPNSKRGWICWILHPGNQNLRWQEGTYARASW